MMADDADIFFSAMRNANRLTSTYNLQGLTSDPCGTVPLEHLDYGYIEKCKDVKYMEKILRVLR